MQILLLLTAGLVTGVMSGLFGIGGGVFLVPILVLIMGFRQHTANGISLAALLLPVGILGVIQYMKSGQITSQHLKFGLMIASGIFVGTYFGSQFANKISDAWLRKGFSLFLLFVAIKMWFLHDAI